MLEGRQVHQRHDRRASFGVLVEDGFGYGEIAPLPGFSPEDLDTAQRAIIAVDLGSRKDEPAPTDKPLISKVTTPSVFFGFRCASDALTRARKKADGASTRKRISVNGLITGSLDEALAKLSSEDQTLADLIKLHCFAGLPLVQVADILGMSHRTTERHWAFARAWLNKEIFGD